MGKKKSEEKSDSVAMSLPYEEIHTLMRMVSEMGLGELHVQSQDLTIRVVGGGGAKASDQEAAADSTPPTQPDEAGLHYITSPMVGTYYQASRPGADPYVAVGHEVSRGQVLCIVEAMKLMNEIEADMDGVVAEICCKDAQVVEFGDRLFGIRVGHPGD